MSESTRNKEKIRQRDYKLNALLDITVAINSNLSIDELLRQYEKVLREQLSIDRLILFAKQDHWRCILKFGINRGVPEITDESFFQQLKEINFTTSQTKKSFDVSIPIKQNDETIAYLLAGDESEDEIKMSPVVKHMRFIQTLTNVLVVAIQNRKLQEESLPAYEAEDQAWLGPLPLTKDVASVELCSFADGVDVVLITATAVELEATLRQLEPRPGSEMILQTAAQRSKLLVPNG